MHERSSLVSFVSIAGCDRCDKETAGRQSAAPAFGKGRAKPGRAQTRSGQERTRARSCPLGKDARNASAGARWRRTSAGAKSGEPGLTGLGRLRGLVDRRDRRRDVVALGAPVLAVLGGGAAVPGRPALLVLGEREDDRPGARVGLQELDDPVELPLVLAVEVAVRGGETLVPGAQCRDPRGKRPVLGLGRLELDTLLEVEIHADRAGREGLLL